MRLIISIAFLSVYDETRCITYISQFSTNVIYCHSPTVNEIVDGKLLHISWDIYVLKVIFIFKIIFTFKILLSSWPSSFSRASSTSRASSPHVHLQDHLYHDIYYYYLLLNFNVQITQIDIRINGLLLKLVNSIWPRKGSLRGLYQGNQEDHHLSTYASHFTDVWY